jgi:hypothetical protein
MSGRLETLKKARGRMIELEHACEGTCRSF